MPGVKSYWLHPFFKIIFYFISFIINFRAKSKDLHLPAYQTVVKISHTHNHMNDSADTLKHRDVSKETIEKFKDLFSKGHSPASALNTHKLDLQLQYDQDYVYEAADRANCPDTQFCHR